MHRVVYTVSALFLTACGGSGSGPEPKTSIANVPQSNTAPPPPTVYYEEIKNAIPSLSLYYERTCGKAANVFILPSIDANNDGRNDLFMVFWCGPPEYGMKYDGPPVNTLVSLLQNNDGTFRLGNQEVFGKPFVELTGVVAERADIAVGDFNGDGKQDYAFATVLEDGRQFIIDEKTGTSSWDTSPVVVMSQPDGTYKVSTVGPKGMYESIAVIKGDGKDRFAAGGYLFSFDHDQWSLTRSTFNIDRTTKIFGNMLTMNVFTSEQFGYQAGVVDERFNYTQTQYLPISDVRIVTVHNNAQTGGTATDQYLITVDDKDYVTPAFNSVCVIPTANKDEHLIMAQFEAIPLNERYTGQRLEWNTPGPGEVSGSNGISRVFVYKVTADKIEKVNMEVFDRNFQHVHYFDCLDVNGDGRVDLAVYIWGHKQEKSFVFLNDGVTFKEVSQEKLPDINTIYHGHTTLMVDLNGDKQAEIIHGPGLGYKQDYMGIFDDYQMFKSVSPLK